jgi:hypothetical protein
VPYFFVDDSFSDSKEVMAIPARSRNAAIGLWTLCGAWSAGKLTDGKVPLSIVRSMSYDHNYMRVVQKLIDVNLWHIEGDSVVFRNWSKWQRTKDQVLTYRRKDATRKAAGRGSSTTADTPVEGGRVRSEREASEKRERGERELSEKRERGEREAVDALSGEDADLSGMDAHARAHRPKPVPKETYVTDDHALGDAREPAVIENRSRPAKRHPSNAARTVVRHTLGEAGYPRTTTDRLAIQVDKLAHDGHPDIYIRESLIEWDRRPGSTKPEFLPTVLGDVIKAARASPTIHGPPLQGADLRAAENETFKHQINQQQRELP